MRVSDIFAQGGDCHHGKGHGRRGHYSYGGYYGNKGGHGYGYYNGYNRGHKYYYYRDDDDGLLGLDLFD
ncbi:MAG: hypothetical protein ACRDS1_16325 [Pseudonocardiaceae bacterium]